jgi:murein DD-endopeptidase MepM/ murein hydrolase activator NlpD
MPFGKNIKPFSLLFATVFLYAGVAHAFIFDFIFGSNAKNEATTSIYDVTKNATNLTVQNMDVLGEGILNGKKNTQSIIKKLFNSDSSAFSVEQGALHTNVDIAVEEENSHTMDELAVYTVKKNDSIASIASYFEISPETIITFNKLDGNKVSEGDVLEIPQISGILYTVKKGDTLVKISKDYKVDSEDISLYNAIIPELALTAGDDIFLPGAKMAKLDQDKDITKTKVQKEKERKDKETKLKLALTKAKQNNGNDKVAIAKIKRFATRFSDLPQYEGYYGNPAPGSVRSQKLHGANGADLAAPQGTDILASAAGTVAVAKSTGWNYGYGQYIVITHGNGTQTVYAHLSNVDVVPGQVVVKGEKIGDMGSTGKSTGSHVHFEVRGAYNPFAW